MAESKTRLKHTCPTEEPFDCITGDLSGEGFLIIIDRRTHELVVEPDAGDEMTVRVNPKGVAVADESSLASLREATAAAIRRHMLWKPRMAVGGGERAAEEKAGRGYLPRPFIQTDNRKEIYEQRP
jgi:hypothetical protein